MSPWALKGRQSQIGCLRLCWIIVTSQELRLFNKLDNTAEHKHRHPLSMVPGTIMDDAQLSRPCPPSSPTLAARLLSQQQAQPRHPDLVEGVEEEGGSAGVGE